MNVESLSKRINTAPAKPVESYNYETTRNDVTTNPTISSTHSSPQNSNINYANLPQSEHTVDDDNANNANENTKSQKSKALNREPSIKYVNDAEDEPVYYNEPPYYEQPGNSFRFNVIQNLSQSTFTTTFSWAFLKSFHSHQLLIYRNKQVFPFFFFF